MRVTSVQPTPNPQAFKFLTDRTLTREIRNYNGAKEAAGDLLATALFSLPGVQTLFFCENFVTVTFGGPAADWRTLKDRIVQMLETMHVEEPATGAAPAAGTVDTDDVEMMRKINEVLDDRVRPALAGDGGGLEVLELRGKTLRIRYQGACGSCPSSIAGTLSAIQSLLQSEIDEELSVVSA